MKTTEDERKIKELYHVTVHQIKTYRPSFLALTKVADDYLRSIKAASAFGMQLGDLFMQMSKEQSSNDIENTYYAFGKSFKEVESKKETVARALFDEIFVPLKKHLESDKKMLEDVMTLTSKKEKEAKTNLKKATEKAKKMKKNTSMLQSAMQELNARSQEAQQVHINSLRSILLLQRGKYCSVAGHMGGVLERIQDLNTAEKSMLTHYLPSLKDLNKQTKNISSDVQELVKKQTRTLLDLSKISSQWKSIFKDAGVKKSDLRDAETARYILATIEQATGQKIDIPTYEELMDYDDGTGGGYSGGYSGGGYSDFEKPPPPPPPRHIPPPPPRNVQSFASAPPEEEEEEDEPAMAYTYVPPAPELPAAPAVPNMSLGAPGGRGALLSQIHEGTTLRSVAPARQAELPEVSNTNDITSVLRNAMLSRRAVVVDDEVEDEEADEWSE